MTITQEAEREIIEAAESLDILVDKLPPDGELQRYPTKSNPKGKNGAVKVHRDDPVSAYIKNWATGEELTITPKGKSWLTAEERAALLKRIESDKKALEAERIVQYAKAADRARRIYSTAAECTEHEYLTTKRVKPDLGLKLHKGALVVPLYYGGKIVSIQFINKNGSKFFLTGGRVKSCFFPIGGKDISKPLVICEGVATGLSLHESMSHPVLVAFTAGNLLPGAQFARAKYPEREIIIAADYDNPCKAHPEPGGPGVAYAREAAKAVNGFLSVPDMGGKKCDWNDVHQMKGVGNE